MVEEFLEYVTSHYLNSDQFNGVSLGARFGKSSDTKFVAQIERMIVDGAISLNFGDEHPNPHIKALVPPSAEQQIQKLRERGFDGVCVYPERCHLERVVDQNSYAGRPYTLALALGAAQLEHRAFDLSVLERYRNDPRFSYRNDDISGTFSISDEFFGADGAPEKDQVSMQTFGFCFDEQLSCYVAAFLRYLTDLSPTHQQHWAGMEVRDQTNLHPDYFRPSFLGEFPERISMYSAVLEEIRTINLMARAIRGDPLFRREYVDGDRPKHFGRLVRPTTHEFDKFIQTLDQLLSDNLNADWFSASLPREREIKRADGQISVRPAGSIELLEAWIHRDFRLADQESCDNIADMLKTFREVRRLRMRPAHAQGDDTFRQELTREQRELVKRACRAVKTLRLAMSLHPKAKETEVSEHIADGRIWTI